MITLYQPGNSYLHRASAGIKLGALVILSVVVSAIPHTVWSVAAVLVGIVLLFLSCGLGIRPVWRTVWQLRVIIVALAVFLAIFVNMETSFINTARMFAVVLLATLVTATTRASDLLDVLHTLMTPLERFGVDADAVAMTLLLTVSFVPVIADFASQVREAERARGVRLGLRVVMPMLVRTLRLADDVGDALRARGLA